MEEKERIVNCPCCGANTFKIPGKISEKLLDQYIASVVSGLPFKNTYNMYDGKVQAVMQDLSSKDADLLAKLGAKTATASDAEIKDLYQSIVSRVYRYIMLAKVYVKKLNGTDLYSPRDIVIECVEKAIATDDIQQLKDLYNKMLDTKLMSGLSDRLIDPIVNAHNKISDILVQSGFSDDFFRDITHA